MAPAVLQNTPPIQPRAPVIAAELRQQKLSDNELIRPFKANPGQQMGVGGDVPQVSVQSAAGISAGATTCPATLVASTAAPGPGAASVSN